MSKSVRVKVEFEMQVVVNDEELNEALDIIAEAGTLTPLGAHWAGFPVATRYLAVAENMACKTVRTEAIPAIIDASADGIRFGKVGNVRAQVISEKK